MTTTAPAPTRHHLITVNPADLKVDDQVRSDATPDGALIASVRRSGVLQPPTVRRNADREYVIITGHRRVGAAIAAGLTSIEVLVRAGEFFEDAITLEEQIVENERRAALSARDLAAGYQQLELFGLTPEDIATALAESTDRVNAGLRAVKSSRAKRLLQEEPTIDLAQAAVIAEFDGHKKHQDQLIEYATKYPASFAHQAESLRRTIALEEEIARRVEKLKKAGVTVVKVQGYMSYRGKDDKGRALDLLTTPDGEKITATAHKKCPGHVAWVTGWSPDDVKTHYGCSNWEANGHKYSNARPEPTEEELRAQQEREERAERVAANRTVRRRWIHDLLPGKINQLPGVYEYMAAALLDAHGFYGADHRSPSFVLPMLDIDATGSDRTDGQVLDELLATKRVAPFRLMLATAFAIHEARCELGRTAFVIRHLEQLQRWGYPLSEVDQESLTAAHDAIDAAAARAAERAVAESTSDEQAVEQ